jgi:hypothetical protein
VSTAEAKGTIRRRDIRNSEASRSTRVDGALSWDGMLESLFRRASSRLHVALRYWLSLKPGQHLLPARSSIDPVAIPRLLPQLLLAEVVRDPEPRLMIRIAGDNLRDRSESSMRGRSLADALQRANATGLQRIIDLALAGHVIWRRGKTVLDITKDYHHTENVILPFAEDGSTVDHVMIVVEFLDQPCREELASEPGLAVAPRSRPKR